MFKYLLILALCLTGCEEYQHVPAPQRKPSRPGKNIVLVTMDNCVHCDRQKNLLNSMDLPGVTVIEVNHTRQPATRSEYPATQYPTLYVNRKVKLVGYQTREKILEALEQ